MVINTFLLSYLHRYQWIKQNTRYITFSFICIIILNILFLHFSLFSYAQPEFHKLDWDFQKVPCRFICVKDFNPQSIDFLSLLFDVTLPFEELFIIIDLSLFLTPHAWNWQIWFQITTMIHTLFYVYIYTSHFTYVAFFS